jgi:hypothetical protein
MALTYITLEQLVDWCSKNQGIADIRAKARSDFFGYYDSEPLNYVADTGDVNRRERRFLGYFALNFKLPDGKHPAELAADALLRGAELNLAVKAILAARYVTGVAIKITRGRGFHLELENDEFAVSSAALSRTLKRGQAVSAHLVPTSRGRYLLAPGWLAWPIVPGPEMRSELKSVFQPTPIEVERFLQGRVKEPDNFEQVEPPQDDTLEAAVGRMTEAAKRENKTRLIMSPEEWKGVVLSHMVSHDSTGFVKELYKRMGEFQSIGDVNRWLALAANIWNNTPQPDRGGKSAHQIIRELGCNRKKPCSLDE